MNKALPKTRGGAATNPHLHSTLKSEFNLKFKHKSPRPRKCRPMTQQNGNWESLLNLSSDEAWRRKREWNRGPLMDLFPRIPAQALERCLDICMAKPFTYNLSQSKLWSSRRLTSIVIAHVRHTYSDYDKLLRDEDVERYEARRRTKEKVWKVLKEWCPWDSSNEVLGRCFEVTLLRREERPNDWDPMQVDSDDDEVFGDGGADLDDPMDLD